MDLGKLVSASALSIALAALLVAGCGDGRRAGIPPAPAPGNVAVAAGWAALTNAEQVAKTCRAGEDKTQSARFHLPGVVALPAEFTKDSKQSRACWDFKLPLDLSTARGVQFDVYCDNLEAFSHCSIYFKSGEGWYHASFSPEDNGRWERICVDKAQTEAEGHPAGWERISLVRISLWRADEGKALFALANLGVAKAVKPDVGIVYADSLVPSGADKKSYLHFADTVLTTISAAGVDATIIADTDLSDAGVAEMKALVLPYNSMMPPEKIAVVSNFVASGRKVLACYTQPKEVLDLLGVKLGATIRAGEGVVPSIGGFLRMGAGLAGQPVFSPQASWMTFNILPAEGCEVVAEWGVNAERGTGLPALVRTRSGLYMGHIWNGGADGEQVDFMRAIVCELAPELKTKLDAKADEARRRQEEMRKWLAERPSKRGEHRAFWCHSARGLGGGRDWDASIRLLRENGFNAIVPNLCWGGVAFYDSKVLPVAADVAKKGDAFEQCQAACKKYGVKMHVWKVCWNMGHLTSAKRVKEMLDAGRTQVDVNGKARERWLCPSHPDNQRLEIEAMVELAKKRPDGIHFDYIRYPGADCCFCAGCRERFEQRLGRAVENWPNDVRGKGELHELWNDFRASNITYVVRTVAERVRKEAKGVQISAALFRSPRSDRDTVAQDWPAWCREGLLDFACHMDYVDSPRSLAVQMKLQKAAAGKVKLYPGLGLSCWHDAARDGEKLAKQIQAVRDLGLDGFTVFNFDRRAERVLPLMRLGVTKED